MQSDYESLLRNALEEYLQLGSKEILSPDEYYLDFNFDFLENRKLTWAAESIICGELQELTNLLNAWQSSLRRWGRWNKVVSSKDEQAAWALREEFVEAVAHECLLRPHSIRDIFTSVATNALHQIRLITEPDRIKYPDFLEGDPKKPNEHPRHIRREKVERLSKLANHWQESSVFVSSLKKLDDQNYRDLTQDYRNLASHTIGPRLAIGDTKMVTRTVTQATNFPDRMPISGTMDVSYTFGFTSPLNLEQSQCNNLEQYKLARCCHKNYLNLLRAAVTNIALKAVG
jgi:hypothetical protein